MDHIENAATLLDKNTLALERRFAMQPEELWEAIATKEGLSHWFMPTEYEIEEGGRFSFEGGWDGTISHVRPPHHIQFTPDGSEPERAYLRFEIQTNRGGCVFRLIDRMGPAEDVTKLFPDDAPRHSICQPGGPGTHWSGVIAGYHGFVDRLEGYITGSKLDFDIDLSEKYVTLLGEWFDTSDDT